MGRKGPKGGFEMKKYRVKNQYRFITFVTVCILAIVFVCGAASGIFDARAVDVQSFVTVRVQPGDTLWNLARTYGPEGVDTRVIVYAIGELNGVSASTLRPGQYLNIPTSL